MIEYLIIVLSAFCALFLTKGLMPYLRDSGVVGRDMNKPDRPKIAEMGGVAIIAAFVVILMGVVFLNTIGAWMPTKGLDSEVLIAGVLTIVIAAFIGVVDDVIRLKQWQKALLPIIASVPLIAVKAGVSSMWLPFLGMTELGIAFYILVIPIIVTGATNATNMLAGFNGEEAALGAVSLLILGAVAFNVGNYEAAVIGLAMGGALIGFLYYNKCPAVIFPGDVGTHSIGAAIAAVTILGNLHTVGGTTMCLYLCELVLKARGGFKTQSWCRCQDGLLICNSPDKVHGVGRLLMRITGGISERKLVGVLIVLQIILVMSGAFLFYL